MQQGGAERVLSLTAPSRLSCEGLVVLLQICFSSCCSPLLSQMFPLLLRRAAQALLLPSLAVLHRAAPCCRAGLCSPSAWWAWLQVSRQPHEDPPQTAARLSQQHVFIPHKHSSVVDWGRHRRCHSASSTAPLTTHSTICAFCCSSIGPFCTLGGSLSKQ